MKLLVVDDDEIIVEAICQLIKRSKMDITITGTAYNAKDAILIAERESPDIILTDINMPEMSGIDLMCEIKRKGILSKIIVLSAYRDFEYAQQALKFGASEYILKPVSEQKLVDTLSNVINVIISENQEKGHKRELVKDRLYYAITSDKMHKKNESDINIFLPAYEDDGYFRVTVFEFNENDNEVVMNDRNIENEIVNIIKNTFCNISPNIIFENDPYNIVVVMKIYEGKYINYGENVLISDALNTKNEILEKSGLKVNIGISNPVKSISDIPSAYKKAVFATRSKFYIGRETISVYDNMKDMDTVLTNKIFKKVIELADQIKLLASEKALSTLDSIFELFSENSNVNPDNIYTECFEIVLVLKYEISKLISNRQSQNLLFKATIDEVKKYGTIVEIYNLLAGLITDCIASLSQEQEEGGSAIISKAINFCKNNLSQDITLDILAEHININKSYFSFLFKKEIGVNFWDYLTNLKLSKAKELLTETNLKSYEIAGMVGYRNASHFGKVFKEHTGLTPSEFKEKITYTKLQ